MDIENMRRNWEDMNQRLSSLEGEVNKMKIESMETAQQRLIRQYRRISILGIVGALVFCWPLKEIISNPWPVIAFCSLLLISAMMDFCLMRKVRRINLTDMSVSQVAFQAKECRRLHHFFQLILLPLVISLLVWLGFTSDDEYFRYGLIAGAIAGLIVGGKVYLEFMRNYKELIKKSTFVLAFICLIV